MFDYSDIAGLTYLGLQRYTYENNVALSGIGASYNATPDANFHYDDTAFGQVPAGLLKVLASCAINMTFDTPHEFSGQYVQVRIGVGVGGIGSRRSFYTGFPIGFVDEHGHVTDFTVKMPGVVEMADPFQSTTIDGLVTVASELPFNATNRLYGMLLRPSALSWSGQDPTNEANRTIWLYSEIDHATVDFAVSGAQAISAPVEFCVMGWL